MLCYSSPKVGQIRELLQTTLSLHLPQFFLDLIETWLYIACGCLDSWGSMFGNVTQIDCQFAIIQVRFFFRAVGKVMAQIVEGNIRDELPFFPRCRLLHRFEPLMDRGLTQPPPIQVAFDS